MSARAPPCAPILSTSVCRAVTCTAVPIKQPRAHKSEVTQLKCTKSHRIASIVNHRRPRAPTASRLAPTCSRPAPARGNGVAVSCRHPGHTESPPDTTPVSVRRTEGVGRSVYIQYPPPSPSPTPPVCWTRLVRPLRTRASSINILNKINSGTPTTATPLSAHASLPLHIRSASIAILAHRHRA